MKSSEKIRPTKRLEANFHPVVWDVLVGLSWAAMFCLVYSFMGASYKFIYVDF